MVSGLFEPDIQSALPPIDLQALATRAMQSHGAQALYAGYGILVLGCVLRLLMGYWRSLHDEPAGYMQALTVTALLSALLAAYPAFTHTTIWLISNLGHGYAGPSSLDEAMYQRMLAYSAYDVLHGHDGPLAVFTADGFMTALLKSCTLLLYICVQAAAFVLRCLQLFSLAVILCYGPLLLGVAALGPFFMSLGIGWLWALVEVSAWSVTCDILMDVFGDFARHVPQDFNTATEIVVSLVMLTLFVSVPVLTSMLLRSQAAGSISHSTALVFLGAARRGMHLAQRSPPYQMASGALKTTAATMQRGVSRGVGTAGAFVAAAKARSGRSVSSPRETPLRQDMEDATARYLGDAVDLSHGRR